MLGGIRGSVLLDSCQVDRVRVPLLALGVLLLDDRVALAEVARVVWLGQLGMMLLDRLLRDAVRATCQVYLVHI